MKTILAAALVALVVGCSQSKVATGTGGALSVALTEAASNAGNPSLAQAPDEVTSVMVSVTRVRAHVESLGWILLSDVPVQVDLLALPAAGPELGFARLPAGKVTQIRLLVAATGNYVQTTSGTQPLVVPSGIESGIKIPGPWQVSACNETVLSLEFSGKKSVWYHPTGSGSPWILRPVIHVKKVRYAQTSCDEGPACQAASCPSGICDASGECAEGGANDACTNGSQCLSGDCAESHTCLPGGAGDPCREAADCVSGTCTRDGTGEGTCAPGSAGGTGSDCLDGTACLSQSCVEGFCAPGAEGAACNLDGDCQTDLGLACIENTCVLAQ